jgi:hypothetical protein
LAAVHDAQEFVVKGVLAVIREITDNELLQRLLVTDAEAMLSLLTGMGAPVLALGRSYISAQLRRLIDEGAPIAGDPEALAELIARLVLSLALNRETVLPLADGEALERLVRSTLAPLIMPASPAAP